MPKCLVTGAAGFIGSALIRKLLAEGAEVFGIDRVAIPQATNLKDAITSGNFKYTSMDISEDPTWAGILPEVSEIYILASVVGVQRVVQAPGATIKTALAQINALDRSDLTGKSVFFASTSEVYGKTAPGSISNELDDLVLGSPAKPRWAYASSKLLAEHLLIALAKIRGFKVKIGRLFNIVGPGQNRTYGAVIPNFVSRALSNQPLPVYGDGSQTRSFCHVQDAVEGVIRLARSKPTPYEVFNIGNPEAITILDLAREVNRYFGNTSKIIFEPYCNVMPDGFEEIMFRAPDVSKIQKHTNWQCKLGLMDIFRDIDLHIKGTVEHKGRI